MKTILHLISSPREQASVSIQLGIAIVAQLQQKYPRSTVIEVNLIKQNIPHLDCRHLQLFFNANEQLAAADKEILHHSDEAISQLMAADIIVIGAPMYNFNIHSALKAWIDHITRAGKTFRNTEQGREGLVKGKKVYLAAASGGVYANGPRQTYDFAVSYMKTILGFLGMTDVTVYRAEGVSVPELKDQALAKAIASIDI